MVRERDFSDFEFRVSRTAELAAADLDDVMRLFRACYRQANEPYIEKSLARLAYLALAYHGGAPAGFAMGDVRRMDLPRLPDQVVNLAGICCIDLPLPPPRPLRQARGARKRRIRDHDKRPPPGLRAHGAPGELPRHGPQPFSRPQAGCPADGGGSERWARPSPTPTAPTASTPRRLSSSAAARPIGYPVIDIECEPSEWEVFKPVDRDRGDSLLGISWGADPPPGWYEDD